MNCSNSLNNMDEDYTNSQNYFINKNLEKKETDEFKQLYYAIYSEKEKYSNLEDNLIVTHNEMDNQYILNSNNNFLEDYIQKKIHNQNNK